MASGLVFDHNGKKVDLEDLVEVSRDTKTDPPCPLAPAYVTNLGLTGLGFYGGTTASLLAHDGRPFGTGIILPPEFESARGTCPPLMEKGTRPRLTTNKYLELTIPGQSQIFYYFAVRTESTLYILRSSNSSSGYSVAYSYSKSMFPNSGIPKILYGVIVGGGGGGAGGTGVQGSGGGGGGGGAFAYFWFPVRLVVSIPSKISISDFRMSIGNGGNGGRYGEWYQASPGGTGDAGHVVLNSKDLITVNGGRGATYPKDGPSNGAAGGSVSIQNTGNNHLIKSVNGTNGSRGNGYDWSPTNASDISFTLSYLHETLTHSSAGGQYSGSGGSWPFYRQPGGGGGASYGRGGMGYSNSNLGYGGGGGGGAGQIGHASNGCKGGAGLLKIFY